MQHEALNDRSYYVGSTDENIAIAFDNCGEWLFQELSDRSVRLHLSEDSLCSLLFQRNFDIELIII